MIVDCGEIGEEEVWNEEYGTVFQQIRYIRLKLFGKLRCVSLMILIHSTVSSMKWEVRM